jgi:hypothetical protein
VPFTWPAAPQAPPGRPAYAGIACQVAGRVVTAQGRWGLAITDGPPIPKSPRTMITLNNQGVLFVEDNKSESQPTTTHPAIKKAGGQNTLLVVVCGRYLEVYVNGVAVRDPLVLDRALSSPTLALAAASARRVAATAEFDSITVWPADSVPPPDQRGAVPRP